MRLVSFRHADAQKFGALVDGGIVDFSARWPGLREALGAVELLPTIPNPDKILCIGLNYASHVGEVGRQLPTVPSVFSRLHNTLVRHGGDIVRPSASTHF